MIKVKNIIEKDGLYLAKGQFILVEVPESVNEVKNWVYSNGRGYTPIIISKEEEIKIGDTIYVGEYSLDYYKHEIVKDIQLPLITKCTNINRNDVWINLRGNDFECESGAHTTVYKVLIGAENISPSNLLSLNGSDMVLLECELLEYTPEHLDGFPTTDDIKYACFIKLDHNNHVIVHTVESQLNLF